MKSDWIVSICQHGNVVAAASPKVSDDEKREFALCSDRIELRATVKFEGGCEPCRERYIRNCAAIGVMA